MNEANQRLLEIVNEKKYLSKIARELKKSQIEAHKRIMRVGTVGYNFYETYYDNGEIEYTLKPYKKKLFHTANLKLSQNERILRCVCESDMHYGHRNSNMEYKKRVYDYCDHNDIHLIIDCGDIIDGISDRNVQNIINPEKQIESLIENHPYDKKIINFVNYGNHEFKVKREKGLDVAKMIYNKRPDLIPVGYGIGIINILNDQIILKHKIEEQDYNEITNHLALCGHSHRFAYKFLPNNLEVTMPPLSNNCYQKQQNPGIVDMTLYFDENGKIEKADFCHLSVLDKIYYDFKTSLELPFESDNIKENDLQIRYYNPPKIKKRNRKHLP